MARPAKRTTRRGILVPSSGVAAAAGITARSPASFDLCANGGIGGFKGRLRPRGAASGGAKEREQDEENANCSPIIGHRKPIPLPNSRSDHVAIALARAAQALKPVKHRARERHRVEASCRPGDGRPRGPGARSLRWRQRASTVMEIVITAAAVTKSLFSVTNSEHGL